MEVRRRDNNDDELREENYAVVFKRIIEPPEESQEVFDIEDKEERRCTVSVAAYQNNMSELVAQELLRTDTDLTLCVHSQQTLLHLSSPELQREMLRWMSRPHLSLQAQLLQAAWQGDSASMTHLLTQTDNVDVNIPNSDGVTAVMLAIRDIDLFEGLVTWLPWEHRPLEVIKDLLEFSADLSARDDSGCSALQYAANICSPRREDIVQILFEALSPTDKGIPICVQNTMETLKSTGRANQDVKRGSSRGLCLPSLSNNNRHWGGADPSPSTGLLNTRTPCQPVPPRQRQRTRSVVDGSPPSHGQLSVTESSQLSQSAPSIMGPLLCSNTMMQARANIQTRLGSQNTSNEQKAPLPVFRSRTCKLLAPLDGRPKDSKALPALQPHIPLKPISRLCTKTEKKRDRLSWDSPRKSPPTNKAGSEESGSSSLCSLPFENEDNDVRIQETTHKDRNMQRFLDGSWQHSKDVISSEEDFSEEMTQHFKVRPGISQVLLADGATHKERDHHLSEETAEKTHCEANKMNDMKSAESDSSRIFHRAQKKETLTSVKRQTLVTSAFSEDKRNVGHLTKSKTEKSNKGLLNARSLQDDATGCSENKSEQLIKEAESIRNEICNNKSSPVELNTSTADGKTGFSSVDSNKDEMVFKALKLAQDKERKTSLNCRLRANRQTNQSFNILGHVNQNILSLSRSKINKQFSEVSVDVRSPGLAVAMGNTLTKVKLKMKSIDSVHFKTRTPPPRKVCEPQQSNPTHQHTTKRELKSAQQSKKPCLDGKTPRSKSAVDFITYKDLFQQIQSGDEGPAMYEMFAGPLFENFRVSSSCEKPKERHLQYAATKRAKQGHKVKHRPIKSVQNKLKQSSGVGTNVSTKSKTKPVAPRMKPHSATKKAVHRTGSSPKVETKIVSAKDADVSPKRSQEESEDCALSTIEEAVSRYGSETLKPDDETMTTPTSSIHVIDYRFMDEHRAYLTQNPAQQVPEVELSPSPQQSKLNTWTSSDRSCHSIMSPVYKKFLDEVGDGPLTDDLLQCLAEELISLDERDVSSGPEDPKQRKQFKEEQASGKNGFPEVVPLDNDALLSSGLVVHDNITWTKGEVLGKGAYGTVYCGLTSQGQLIAVKQVSLHSSDASAAKKEYNRLQGEVELLKTLRHINIVGFLGTSLHQHVVSIFMEYIPGGSIASILHRFGPLPEQVLALYTHQILEGVAYLHLNRVIHRDLKGNNVMLMPTGVIKLIDFGCARRVSCLNHTACNSGELLKSVQGTPYWMAPEVISESGYGRKSDVWSVGCTVFEMATGKPPLAHMDKMAALFYIGAERGSMPMLPDGFSENAKDFVKKCLTCDQRLRPSADQLLRHPFVAKKETNVNSWVTYRKKCDQHVGQSQF